MKQKAMVVSIRETRYGPRFTVTRPWMWTYRRQVYSTPEVVLHHIIGRFDGPVKIRRAK